MSIVYERGLATVKEVQKALKTYGWHAFAPQGTGYTADSTTSEYCLPHDLTALASQLPNSNA